MSEHFCYIAMFKARINLGFYYGANLSDPNNLMDGPGKLLRHIKISTLTQLEDPALLQLITAASKHFPKLNM